MTKRTVKNIGYTEIISLPKQLCEELGITTGSEVNVSLSERKDKLEIAPLRPAKV